MKKSGVILFFLSFTLTLINAQLANLEYGKISQKEADYVHLQDPDAEAVVIFDIGKSSFGRTDSDYEIFFERTTRIKILSEAGLKWADIEIPFYYGKKYQEEVKKIKAITYNYNGVNLEKSMLVNDHIYEEKLNEYRRVKKFAMPDVKPGSIIDISYQIVIKDIFDFRDWEFQWEIPVIYSKYTARMIPFYEYTYLLQGAESFDDSKSYIDRVSDRRYGTVTFQDYVHEFTMKDIPAFKDESFISSKDDYILKLDFQLSSVIQPNGSKRQILTTWPKMIDDLIKDENFGKYVKKSTKSGLKSTFITGMGQLSEKEKFNEILDYVKSNYNWDGYHGKFAYKSVKDLETNKYGASADINLYAVGLLRAAGIEAYPVIISTRNNGKIKYDYPFSHFFNFVIIMAVIDDKMILTDATDPMISNYRIPPRCINDKGLLIKENEVTWLDLTSLTESLTTTSIQIEPADLTTYTKIDKSFTEYMAYSRRKRYRDDKEKLGAAISDKGYNLNDTTLRINDATDIKKPYRYKFQAEVPTLLAGDKIFVIPFLNEVIKDNPLKQKKRTYNIDKVYTTKHSFISIIEIPEGFEVEHLPEARKIDNSLFQLSFNVLQNGDKVNVMLTYTFKKPVYPPGDYVRLKYYYDEIVKYGNKNVVLRKK